ncbi:MAG: hypothetical protein JSS49_07125 [Planctomycetes bacterium]|nr:hypothetical protein [Planctomycetota bacterium]
MTLREFKRVGIVGIMVLIVVAAVLSWRERAYFQPEIEQNVALKAAAVEHIEEIEHVKWWAKVRITSENEAVMAVLAACSTQGTKPSPDSLVACRDSEGAWSVAWKEDGCLQPAYVPATAAVSDRLSCCDRVISLQTRSAGCLTRRIVQQTPRFVSTMRFPRDTNVQQRPARLQTLRTPATNDAASQFPSKRRCCVDRQSIAWGRTTLCSRARDLLKHNYHHRTGRFVIALIIRRLAFIAILLGAMKPGLAQCSSPIQKLSSRESVTAAAARKKADEMYSAMLKHMEAERMITVASLQRHRADNTSQWLDIQERATAVMAAYQHVIETYPRTEIAAYCVLRLSGVHEQLGDFDKSLDVLERSAPGYRGSYAGMQMLFTIGLTQSQGRNDYAKARTWFSQVELPDSAHPSYREAMVLYVSAQEQIIACDLKLAETAQADLRASELKRTLPEFSNEVDRFYSFAIANQPQKPPIASKSPRRSSIWWVLQISLLAVVVLACTALVLKSRFGVRR